MGAGGCPGAAVPPRPRQGYFARLRAAGAFLAGAFFAGAFFTAVFFAAAFFTAFFAGARLVAAFFVAFLVAVFTDSPSFKFTSSNGLYVLC